MDISLISIIVPVYNTSQYLPKCINSITNQTYKNLEIFLVDDGSTDGSLDICYDFEKQDSRIRVLTKVNGGQGSARNMALDIATGDYISFVDSDDYLGPDAYEKMLNAMKESNADLAVCFLGIDVGNGPVHQKYSFEGTRELSNEELKYLKSHLETLKDSNQKTLNNISYDPYSNTKYNEEHFIKEQNKVDKILKKL